MIANKINSEMMQGRSLLEETAGMFLYLCGVRESAEDWRFALAVGRAFGKVKNMVQCDHETFTETIKGICSDTYDYMHRVEQVCRCLMANDLGLGMKV